MRYILFISLILSSHSLWASSMCRELFREPSEVLTLKADIYNNEVFGQESTIMFLPLNKIKLPNSDQNHIHFLQISKILSQNSRDVDTLSLFKLPQDYKPSRWTIKDPIEDPNNSPVSTQSELKRFVVNYEFKPEEIQTETGKLLTEHTLNPTWAMRKNVQNTNNKNDEKVFDRLLQSESDLFVEVTPPNPQLGKNNYTITFTLEGIDNFKSANQTSNNRSSSQRAKRIKRNQTKSPTVIFKKSKISSNSESTSSDSTNSSLSPNPKLNQNKKTLSLIKKQKQPIAKEPSTPVLHSPPIKKTGRKANLYRRNPRNRR